jgi:hypothetical protein
MENNIMTKCLQVICKYAYPAISSSLSMMHNDISQVDSKEPPSKRKREIAPDDAIDSVRQQLAEEPPSKRKRDIDPDDAIVSIQQKLAEERPSKRKRDIDPDDAIDSVRQQLTEEPPSKRKRDIDPDDTIVSIQQKLAEERPSKRKRDIDPDDAIVSVLQQLTEEPQSKRKRDIDPDDAIVSIQQKLAEERPSKRKRDIDPDDAIVSVLQNLPEEPPSKKKRKIDPEDAIASVRQQLDELGIYGDLLRGFLMEEYNFHSAGERPRPDVYTFLASILNKSVTSLMLKPEHFKQTNNVDSGKLNVTKLMEILDRQCPSLENLSLTSTRFSLVKEVCFRPFLSLRKLTSLELAWRTTTDFTSFFVDIGTACPRLKHLKIGNSWHQSKVKLEDLMSLVLGQNAQLLTASFWQKTRRSEMALHSIQFDEKLLTPICKSLQELSVHSSINEYGEIGSSMTAFLLRHIPRLESLAVRFMKMFGPSTNLAVELLYRQLLQPQDTVQVSEETNKEDGNGGFVHFNLTVHSPPPSKNIQSTRHSLYSSITLIHYYSLIQEY